jgi:hypothetical protein
VAGRVRLLYDACHYITLGRKRIICGKAYRNIFLATYRVKEVV